MSPNQAGRVCNIRFAHAEQTFAMASNVREGARRTLGAISPCVQQGYTPYEAVGVHSHRKDKKIRAQNQVNASRQK